MEGGKVVSLHKNIIIVRRSLKKRVSKLSTKDMAT